MSESPWWLGLAGVLLGGLVTTLATAYLEWKRSCREARALALAFRGEIAAIKDVLAKRDYVGSIRHIIECIEKKGESWPDAKIRVRREYFNVFRSNVGNIGKLPGNLPSSIASYYLTGNAILEDFEDMASGSLTSTSAEQQVAFYKELLALIEIGLAAGDTIVNEIDRRYRRWAWFHR